MTTYAKFYDIYSNLQKNKDYDALHRLVELSPNFTELKFNDNNTSYKKIKDLGGINMNLPFLFRKYESQCEIDICRVLIEDFPCLQKIILNCGKTTCEKYPSLFGLYGKFTPNIGTNRQRSLSYLSDELLQDEVLRNTFFDKYCGNENKQLDIINNY